MRMDPAIRRVETQAVISMTMEERIKRRLSMSRLVTMLKK
jgi:hypothetical protein